jgi:pyroglutamyl-peptidase
MSILFPDVDGYRPTERAIAEGKPALLGHAPFVRLLSAARAAKVPSRVSRDAGRYLCNYVYWRALEASRSGTPLVQFIHIPPTCNRLRRPGRKRRVSHAALVRAGEAILLALLAARRH